MCDRRFGLIDPIDFSFAEILGRSPVASAQIRHEPGEKHLSLFMSDEMRNVFLGLQLTANAWL